ncbi:MAG: hypothetical protein LBH13_08995 [Cellulomonadaceae bacterium]|jgi:prolyl-tRNA editing enzyme YbaK/EbsC (Cys-tRNA(Pro) deacylase)|nr:hypothetical protein [Cellulomonadaceae bacterium]
MTLPSLGDLDWVPAVSRTDLLGEPTRAALNEWVAADPSVASQIAVCEIDPANADTATLTELHALPLEASANCVLVAGTRAGTEKLAACVVGAHTFADVNNRVRKLLDVRKASFLPRERAVETTGQEYGGIGPLGLPLIDDEGRGWRILVDSRFSAPDALALMGSGVRKSKILMPGPLLCAMPGVEVVEDLAIVK